MLLLCVLGCAFAVPTMAETKRCDRLTRSALDKSLALGTSFMLHNQKTAGNFEYQLNWHTMKYTAGDSAVRQAGATWGLALIYQDKQTAKVLAALRKALAFFESHSKTNKDGARYIVYPGMDSGSLGTVALVALAHIDLLRVKPSKKLRGHLKGYLKFIVDARRSDGRFHSGYWHRNGESMGAPSPYYDGESLLALVKAARYLGRKDLRKVALAEAEAGYQANVKDALASDPDSDVTKGYFQWASMAWFEIATWKKKVNRTYADRLLDLADWMIDVHKTLKRTRNTGYAYEGIIPAYAVAKRLKLKKRARKFRCVIDRGMRKLTSWQVGHPLANKHIRKRKTTDKRALGGVQNHRREPQLRIDVTQHQMHAVILARRYVVKP